MRVMGAHARDLFYEPWWEYNVTHTYASFPLQYSKSSSLISQSIHPSGPFKPPISDLSFTSISIPTRILCHFPHKITDIPLFHRFAPWPRDQLPANVIASSTSLQVILALISRFPLHHRFLGIPTINLIHHYLVCVHVCGSIIFPLILSTGNNWLDVNINIIIDLIIVKSVLRWRNSCFNDVVHTSRSKVILPVHLIALDFIHKLISSVPQCLVQWVYPKWSPSSLHLQPSNWPFF